MAAGRRRCATIRAGTGWSSRCGPVACWRTTWRCSAEITGECRTGTRPAASAWHSPEATHAGGTWPRSRYDPKGEGGGGNSGDRRTYGSGTGCGSSRTGPEPHPHPGVGSNRGAVGGGNPRQQPQAGDAQRRRRPSSGRTHFQLSAHKRSADFQQYVDRQIVPAYPQADFIFLIVDGAIITNPKAHWPGSRNGHGLCWYPCPVMRPSSTCRSRSGAGYGPWSRTTITSVP